ncbi:hypothetical protein C5C24_11475 [Rathayibacter sp. AY2B3]|uniref:hypothetical protein n=1 Tax=Rathayibacter sp. AY2B3 TaxID=2080569 RepID=UPI000CE80199|nr:hypothetical protein [Rathayibacter sp. AY2B3]PPG49944.1 hypothetical protein C5C24_11475 [Rathayibacter sp. AY2B3]
MPSELIERDRAQRSMLVSLADSARPAPRRLAAWKAIAVFAISGALTGAAVSATAAVVTSGQVDASYPAATIERLADMVPPTTVLVGDPFVVEAGSGPATLDVGPAPEGESELFVSLGCVDPGTFTTSIDDSELRTTYYCGGGPNVGSGGGTPLIGSGPHTVSVEGTGGYMLWASWSAPAAPVSVSAEQSAATGDGDVTEAEYRDAFGRFQQCMADAGYPLNVPDVTAPVISYSYGDGAYDAGVDVQCYDAEFKQIDMAWQLTNK